MRNFRAKELPEFEAPNIMPSKQRTTVPVQPDFASDKLPKKQPKEPSPKQESGELKDFVF